VFRIITGMTAATGVICLAAHAALGVVTCGVLLAYLGSLVIWPNRDCVSCHGHKSHGREGSANFRRCWTCKGRGRYPRWGVLLLRRDVVNELKAGRHGRNY